MTISPGHHVLSVYTLKSGEEKTRNWEGSRCIRWRLRLGHRTGKPRQAGGKGVGTAEIVGWSSAGGRGPEGDRCSLCQTGEDGKVKYGRDA